MIRTLSGMQYTAIEIEHNVNYSMSDVLYDLAEWVEDHDVAGILTSISTGLHPTNQDKFLTQLVWAH